MPSTQTRGAFNTMLRLHLEKRLALASLFVLVGARGLEPPCLAAYAPEAYVSANFTTRPFLCQSGSTTEAYADTKKEASVPLPLLHLFTQRQILHL